MKKRKKYLKLGIILCTVLALTGCTQRLKDSDNKAVVNETTGQVLTKNIFCQPTEKETIEQYNKNKVKVEDLPKCENLSIVNDTYDGIWDTIFVRPLAWLIVQVGNIVKNYGLAIIITTLLIRLVTISLTKKTALQSENMKKAQPELTRLEQKYKNRTDQESMMMKSQEMMMIYKKYEINPMSGCLFSFLQIPLFLAFYEALNRLPVIFEEHFLGLQLSTTPMAGISNGQYYYLIVIVLVIGASYLSMKLNSTASMSKEQAAQMKMMTNMMIVFLGIASVSLSTGIAIYWVTNSTFTILQNLWVKRRKEKNA